MSVAMASEDTRVNNSDRNDLLQFIRGEIAAYRTDTGSLEFCKTQGSPYSFGTLCECVLIISRDDGSNAFGEGDLDEGGARRRFLFELRLEATPRTLGPLIMFAKRWRRARTDYFIFTTDKEDLSLPRSKRGTGYVGKLRGDESGSGFILYDHGNSQLRRELAAIIFGARSEPGKWRKRSRVLSEHEKAKKRLSEAALEKKLLSVPSLTTSLSNSLGRNLKATRSRRLSNNSSYISVMKGKKRASLLQKYCSATDIIGAQKSESENNNLVYKVDSNTDVFAKPNREAVGFDELSSTDDDEDESSEEEEEKDEIAVELSKLRKMDVAIMLPQGWREDGPKRSADIPLELSSIDLFKRLRFITRKGLENVELRNRVLCLTDCLGREHIADTKTKLPISDSRKRRDSYPPRYKREMMELAVSMPTDHYHRLLLREQRKRIPLSSSTATSSTSTSLPVPPSLEEKKITNSSTPPLINEKDINTRRKSQDPNIVDGVLGFPEKDLIEGMIVLSPTGVFTDTGGSDWGKGARSRVTGAPCEIFKLHFRRPISPLQAFGVALARLAAGGRF